MTSSLNFTFTYGLYLNQVQKPSPFIFYNCWINSKIIFFSSYGGMLSGYMRYKYPHIVDIAVASSAPFYTIAGNRPRSEFFQAVTNVCFLAFICCFCPNGYCHMYCCQLLYKISNYLDVLPLKL